MAHKVRGYYLWPAGCMVCALRRQLILAEGHGGKRLLLCLMEARKQTGEIRGLSQDTLSKTSSQQPLPPLALPPRSYQLLINYSELSRQCVEPLAWSKCAQCDCLSNPPHIHTEKADSTNVLIFQCNQVDKNER